MRATGSLATVLRATGMSAVISLKIEGAPMHFHDYGRHDVDGRTAAARREGKFVLILDASGEHLCMAPRERAVFHANVVEMYCRANDIDFAYNAKHDVLRSWALEVLGGGRFQIDDQGLSLRLFGVSIGYGPFERQGLRDKLLVNEALAGYTIVVEPE